MPVGYPFIVVVGSKGGVGTTTLTAGLLRTARDRGTLVAGLDMTLTNDLSRVLNRKAVSVSSLVRRRERMPARIDRALASKMPFLALDTESALYAERLVEMVRVLAARRVTIADVGSAYGTRGVRPLTPYLALATHIVVVTMPDIRAIARAERLMNEWHSFRSKVIVVENLAEGPPMFSDAIALPRSDLGRPGRWKESAGDTIRALLDRIAPQPSVPVIGSPDEPTDSRGIIRSMVAARR